MRNYCCVKYVWQSDNGCVERIVDEELKSFVLQITGCNISTTFITCPKDKNGSLGIKMPMCTFNWKNILDFFAIEITVLDDSKMHRRLRFGNLLKIPRIKSTFFAVCPMKDYPEDDWKILKFNLVKLTKQAFCSNYIETVRVQINANCRLQRIYFSDILYDDDDIPNEFRLKKKIQRRKVYVPFQKKPKPPKEKRPETPGSSEALSWNQELEFAAEDEANYDKPHPSIATSDEEERETYVTNSDNDVDQYEEYGHFDTNRSDSYENIEEDKEQDFNIGDELDETEITEKIDDTEIILE